MLLLNEVLNCWF